MRVGVERHGNTFYLRADVGAMTVAPVEVPVEEVVPMEEVALEPPAVPDAQPVLVDRAPERERVEVGSKASPASTGPAAIISAARRQDQNCEEEGLSFLL